MKTYIHDGERVTLTAGGTITAGTGVLVGSALFGVAVTGAASGESYTIQTTGLVTITKVGSQAWAVGDAVYWDDGNSRATATAADGDLVIGVATEAVGSGASLTTGTIRLTPRAHPVAVNVADAASGSAAEINALRDALVNAGLMAAS